LIEGDIFLTGNGTSISSSSLYSHSWFIFYGGLNFYLPLLGNPIVFPLVTPLDVGNVPFPKAPVKAPFSNTGDLFPNSFLSFLSNSFFSSRFSFLTELLPFSLLFYKI
jgi:hypothetical protein